MERLKGLPRSPFMDRGQVVVAQMQIGFINSIAFPMFNILSQFLPDLRPLTLDVLVKNVQEVHHLCLCFLIFTVGTNFGCI